VGKTKRGKGSKIMAMADSHGLPVAVYVESATPHEVRLVNATLSARFVKKASSVTTPTTLTDWMRNWDSAAWS
jgi:hypothetical protein